MMRAIPLGLSGLIEKCCSILFPRSPMSSNNGKQPWLQCCHILRRCHAATGLLGDISI